MLRVREIIKDLSYDHLLSEGIIPDIITPMDNYPNTMLVKKYPPFVYSSKSKSNFSFFGYFMEYIVRAGFRIYLKQKINHGIDPINHMIQSLPEEQILNIMENISIYETCNNINDITISAYNIVSVLYGEFLFQIKDIEKYIPTIVNIIKELIIKWNNLDDYLIGEIKFNTEYKNNYFSGHPDIVTDLCVIDVKNTASFKKMSKESCLQVLSYFALIKESNDNIKYCGFILPMQRELVLIGLSHWNSVPFLELLSQTVSARNPKNNYIELNIDNKIVYVNPLMMYNIGSHISKGKNIINTLTNYIKDYPGAPCQMFLRNNRTGKCSSKTSDEIIEASQVILNNNLLYFTHAAYIINLCTNQCGDDGYWAQRILNEDLIMTSALGGCGVVVHTGASMKLPIDDALNTMEHMVREALQYATIKCPLLLETPCGEGSELCSTLEELGNFFMRFTEEERTKLGICCDSCHLTAAGYDPLTYMKQWVEKYPIPIKLVHFNDSKGPCGDHKDRHEAAGFGLIGMKRMIAIAKWCEENNIPMVVE
jgi:deoxyribonuclease-4